LSDLGLTTNKRLGVTEHIAKAAGIASECELNLSLFLRQKTPSDAGIQQPSTCLNLSRDDLPREFLGLLP